MTEFVVGFAISSWKQVALIRKNRPDWQAGLLNGIGGKIEEGESPYEAMIREFEEETSVKLAGWNKFVVMEYEGAKIHFYRLTNLHPLILEKMVDNTDEKLFTLDLTDLPKMHYNMVSGLSWLIPLAMDPEADMFETIHIKVEPPYDTL